MSKNDLIMRGDAEAARDELVRVLNYINSSGTLDYADYCELFNTIEREFDALKFVPHEMTAREYLKTEARMCKYYGVPSAFELSGMTVDEAIKMVEQFGNEHPERSEDDD